MLPNTADVACGFYWTEGNRGLGWAVDATPTLKGGSGLGIPSPPAIRLPNGGGICTPDIRDAERLQGFDADWTLVEGQDERRRNGQRWKMVGNAVSVPVFSWVGDRLSDQECHSTSKERRWTERGGQLPPPAATAHGGQHTSRCGR